MTLYAATQVHDALDAVGFALGAVGLIAVGLGLLNLTRWRRIKALARRTLSVESLHEAAAHAESEQAAVLADVLESAAADVAMDQELEPAQVRAALFSPQDGSWRLVACQPSGGSNPTDAPSHGGAPGELTTEALRAATTERQAVVTMSEDSGWSITLPVLGAEGKPVWILDLESSVARDGVEQLHSAVGRLLYYREALELLLKTNAAAEDRWTIGRKSSTRPA